MGWSCGQVINDTSFFFSLKGQPLLAFLNFCKRWWLKFFSQTQYQLRENKTSQTTSGQITRKRKKRATKTFPKALFYVGSLCFQLPLSTVYGMVSTQTIKQTRRIRCPGGSYSSILTQWRLSWLETNVKLMSVDTEKRGSQLVVLRDPSHGKGGTLHGNRYVILTE